MGNHFILGVHLRNVESTIPRKNARHVVFTFENDLWHLSDPSHWYLRHMPQTRASDVEEIHFAIV